MVSEVSVFFEVRERLTLDGTCYSAEVRRNMENLKKGKELSILLHPNSNEILRMDASGKGIVIFDDAIQALSRSTTVFFVSRCALLHYRAFGIDWPCDQGEVIGVRDCSCKGGLWFCGFPSCQKATALAAATFRESTPWDMGIMTV